LMAGTCDTFAQLALPFAPTIPTSISLWATAEPPVFQSERPTSTSAQRSAHAAIQAECGRWSEIKIA
jgi:hypothetical protein